MERVFPGVEAKRLYMVSNPCAAQKIFKISAPSTSSKDAGTLQQQHGSSMMNSVMELYPMHLRRNSRGTLLVLSLQMRACTNCNCSTAICKNAVALHASPWQL